MAILIKQLHGTAEQFAEYLGEQYTIAINETTGRLHIMDGKTKGGLPLAFASDISEKSADIAANAAAISNLKTSIKTLCGEIVAAKGA